MFSSETKDLNTKMFTSSMNFLVKNLALVSLCTKKPKFLDLELVLDKKMEDSSLGCRPT